MADLLRRRELALVCFRLGHAFHSRCQVKLQEFLLFTLFLVQFVFEVDSERESKECVGLDTEVLGERRGRGGVL